MLQILFLNLESDIGIVAAFVFAHDQAHKGMVQLLKIIEDSSAHGTEHAPHQLEELDVVEQVMSCCSCLVLFSGQCLPRDFGCALNHSSVLQVIKEGRGSRDKAAEVLGFFRRDYPVIVRAVKTRETSQTVLLHKSRFVKSLAKAGLLEEREANKLEVCLVDRIVRPCARWTV